MASLPRTGYLSAGKIIIPWDGTVLHCPLARPRTAVEVTAGIVLVDDHEAVLVRWNDETLPLGPGLHADVQLSRDGRTLAARVADGPRTRLHLIDLADGSRQPVPGPHRSGALQVTGVTADAVWFRVRDVPEQMRWAVGEPGPRQAAEPPPPSGWTGPGAPPHRHYPSADCRRSYSSAWWPPQLVVEQDGERHTHPLPEGARRNSWSGAGPVWEDRDHLLLAVADDPELGDHIRRLDAAAGTWEIAATGVRVTAFVWPRPQP